MSPRVSVVCPAYNATRTIGATIRSVLEQSFADWEMVIVDDGSTDETPEFIETFAAGEERIRLIRQENAGTAGARNRGISESRGEFVAILDNDDLWLPQYLERVVEALDGKPDAGLCHTDAWILDDESGRIHRKTAVEWPAPRPATMDAKRLHYELLRGNFIMASSVTMTRRAIDAAGLFDTSPDVRGSDDWDLWIRIAEAGFGAVRPVGVLAVYRVRSDSVSSNHVLMMHSARTVAAAAIERRPDDAAAVEAARAVIAHSDREIAIHTSRSPLVRAALRIRGRIAAAVRVATRPLNWWAPPAPLATLFSTVDPGRWPGL